MKEGRQKKHKGRKDMEPLIAAKPKTNVPVLICQWGHVNLGVPVRYLKQDHPGRNVYDSES